MKMNIFRERCFMHRSDKYILEPIQAKHVPAVQFLLREVYNMKYPEHYLVNKYSTHHLDIGPLATIAHYEGKPAAMYGVMPQRFAGAGEEYHVGFACDSFTMPAHQKKGLHHDLALLSYEHMRKEGVRLVYAYHSENTYYSCKKLDWHEDPPRMQRFHVKTGVIPFSKAFNKVGKAEWVRKRLRRLVAPFEIGAFANPVIEGSVHGQHYDERFLAYKNTYNWHTIVELKGCHFYLKADAVLHIGAFSYPSNAAFTEGLEQLKSLARKAGISELQFHVHLHSKQYSVLSQIEKPHDSWRVGYLEFQNEVDFSKVQTNYADFDTF